MKTIKFCVKCSDMFNASLRENGEVLGQYEGYVPDFFPGNHYGDYVQMEIDVATGFILNWRKPTKADLKIFKP